MKKQLTPDEQNDQIRAQVERELPTPANGFETDEQAQDHRDAHERRFLELCQNLTPPPASPLRHAIMRAKNSPAYSALKNHSATTRAAISRRHSRMLTTSWTKPA